MILTVKQHGWDAVRRVVFDRDGGCVATQPRIFGWLGTDDDCRDAWGHPCRWDDPSVLEFEHVKDRLGSSRRAPDDEAHGVTVCPWHHRLSQVWRVDSKVHRVATRAWLAKHYPEVWS